MTYQIAAKHCTIADATMRMIERNVDRIGAYLPHLAPDLPAVDIVVARSGKVPEYRGSILLNLPKKLLYVRFSGEWLEEAIQEGFNKLRKEIQVYKGTHFSSDSAYKSHQTIRRSAI